MAEKIRLANHPIDLFVAKAESENLLSLIESVMGLKFCDGDVFSGEFVEVVLTAKNNLQSRSDQESLVRGKGNRKSIPSRAT